MTQGIMTEPKTLLRPIMEVKNLSTHFHSRNGLLKAVDDVSFVVNERGPGAGR